MSSSELKLCSACDKKATLRCARCRTINVNTLYCSTACQNTLYRTHRDHCSMHDGLFIFPKVNVEKEVREFVTFFVKRKFYTVLGHPGASKSIPGYDNVRMKIAKSFSERIGSLILSIDNNAVENDMDAFLSSFLRAYDLFNERSEIWEQSINSAAIRNFVFAFRPINNRLHSNPHVEPYSGFPGIDRTLIGSNPKQWLKDTSPYHFLVLNYQTLAVHPDPTQISVSFALWSRVDVEAEKLMREGKFQALEFGYTTIKNFNIAMGAAASSRGL